MAKIAKQLTELIGHTPLLELTNYEKNNAYRPFQGGDCTGGK